MKVSKARQQEALNRLKEWIKPGDTIYTHVESVARSGMSRTMHVYKMEDNEPRYLTNTIVDALGYSQAKDGALRISGCGMDMGFALVYDMSRVLFRDGFECIGSGCPSNDHNNGDRDYTPHMHSSGGYALRQRWL